MVLGIWVRAADSDLRGSVRLLCWQMTTSEGRGKHYAPECDAGPASECVWLGSDLLRSSLGLLRFPPCGGLVAMLCGPAGALAVYERTTEARQGGGSPRAVLSKPRMNKPHEA
jgi:hypothetical protein